MKRTLIILLCALCACMQSLPVFGWGQEGHRIIAKIAYDNLRGKARKAVDKTLGKQGMIYWANWPDEIKSDTIYAESIRDGWHYQDFAGGMSDSLVLDALVHYPAEGGNMFRALDSLESVLKAKKGDIHTLRFFVHISSDKYCPMHMAHMDDKGGNAVRMAWFSKSNNTNLHAVWDTKLIESQGYSYTEYAEKLQNEYAWQKKDILAMSEEELLLRSYHFTEAIYDYQQTWDGNTYHYIYRWHIPMEEQLYIAGIRLAKALNEIYK
ncbi:MAG: S1/P1 nuclease [Paludibacteraceae bacterium]|nr:S1/P1 nuclease [Paludibacteraceae bacterium]